MKYTIYFLLVFLVSFSAHSQDTLDVYVVNKTNKLTQIGDAYSYFYRDLKYVKEIRELKFRSLEEANQFFEKAYRVLDKDISLVSQGYSLMRNKMNKNMLKIRNKDGGYVYIKRSTLNNMKEALNR